MDWIIQMQMVKEAAFKAASVRFLYMKNHLIKRLFLCCMFNIALVVSTVNS